MIEIEINPEVLQALADELGIAVPTIVIMDEDPEGRYAMGRCSAEECGKKITLYFFRNSFPNTFLWTQFNLITTVLHEMRHVYQHRHWGWEAMVVDHYLHKKPRKRMCEKDANRYSENLLRVIKYKNLARTRKVSPHPVEASHHLQVSRLVEERYLD